jgi:multidrug resistance efflux pump
MSSTKSQTPSYARKAYEDKVAAHVLEAKAKLEQFEAKIKRAQGDLNTINALKAAKQNIDRKLQDLRKVSEANVSRAKADIDADVAALKAALHEFGGTHTTTPAHK